MATSLLSPEARAELLQPRPLPAGRYHDSHNGAHSLCMTLDAAPLVALADDVQRNRRVYEFMTIARPGDLLHYLRVTLMPGDAFLEAELRKAFYPRLDQDAPVAVTAVQMNARFPLAGDDTEPMAEAWMDCRWAPVWREWSLELLALVREGQRRLRAEPDLLQQKELVLMDAGQHRRDWLAAIFRSGHVGEPLAPTMPPAAAWAVLALVRELRLPAVAASETGVDFWRGLCTLQMQRADETGLAPEAALALFASDSGIPLQPEDWGGDVHVSWEGMCLATLVVKPGWRMFDPSRADASGSLGLGLCHAGVASTPMVRLPNGLECRQDRCLVMVTPSDYGELGCAWRLPLDGWVIYVEKTLGVGLARLQEILEAP